MKARKKHKIISSLFSKIPYMVLDKMVKSNLIVPYYHIVSDNEVLHVKNLYPYKNIKQFKNDINFLLKRYFPIHLKELIHLKKKCNSLNRRAFLLTFDDGFREMYDIVAPILTKMGIPATFFISSAFIDNKELSYDHKASILADQLKKTKSPNLKKEIKQLMKNNAINFNDVYRGILSISYHQKEILDVIAQLMNIDFSDYLSRHKPYLTSEQIKELIYNGFTIGAHSIDHPLYSALSLKEQVFQTIESVKMIKEMFYLNYGAFAFPNTDANVSKEFFRQICHSGLVDISFGTGGIINETLAFNIQRFSLEKPLMPAEKIISLEFADRVHKVIKSKVKKPTN